jgi:hypothetical protein
VLVVVEKAQTKHGNARGLIVQEYGSDEFTYPTVWDANRFRLADQD